MPVPAKVSKPRRPPVFPPVPVPATVLKPRRTSRQKEDDGLQRLPPRPQRDRSPDRSTSPLPQRKMPSMRLTAAPFPPAADANIGNGTGRSSGNDDSNGTAGPHRKKKRGKDKTHGTEKDHTPPGEVQADRVTSEVPADSVQPDVQADSDWDPESTGLKHSIATFSNMQKSCRLSKPQVTSIQCYTVAWRALKFEYMSNLDDNQWVSEFFKRYGARYQREATPDLIIDCRLFSWPHGPKGHTGEHGAALLQTVQHKCFPDWLKEVKSKFQKLVHSPDGPHRRIVFICVAGVNRSVSCGRLCWLLWQSLGFAMPEMIKLSEKHIANRRICDRACKNCNDGSRERVYAAESVKAMWQ